MKLKDEFLKEFQVTPEIYEGFISLFNDRNPAHVDDAFASKMGYPGKIMHGNILNGFLSYFIGECLPQKELVIISQEIKYAKPFFLNDKLELKAVVSEIFESVGVVVFSYEFRNEKKERIARGKIKIKTL